MTANQIKMNSSDIDKATIKLNNVSPSPSQSQSPPNSNTNKNKNKNNTNNNNQNSNSSPNQNPNQNANVNPADPTTINSAYSYVASMVGSAYNYVSGYEQQTDSNSNTNTNSNNTNSNSTTPPNKPSMSTYSKSTEHIINGKKTHSKSNSITTINNGTVLGSQSVKSLHSNSPLKTSKSLSPTSKSPPPTSSNLNHSKSKPSNNITPLTPSEINSKLSISFSNVSHVLSSIRSTGVNLLWAKKATQPSPSSVQLRSLTYKYNQKKDIQSLSRSPIFSLIAVQSFKTTEPINNIATHPVSWYSQNINPSDRTCFVFIVHLQVKSLKTSFITYHLLKDIKKININGTPQTDDKSFNKLFDLILNCSDAERDRRFKLIPRIVEGPYPVKRVVENRPVLLGNKVTQKYFRGSNYFEIDAKVDESMVAASILRLCHRFAKRIVVDMVWTIQGEDINELPERILCASCIHNMEFSKCHDINNELINVKNNKIKYTYKKNQEYKQNNK